MRSGTRGVTAAFLVTLSGCAWFGGGGKDRPANVEVTIAAAPRLNPDPAGEPLPTVFRIALLGSAAKAEAAGWEQLYGDPKEALGEDLLASDEVTVSPGETVKKRIAAQGPARALLVLGVFRRPAGTSWRVLVPIERGRPDRVQVHAEDYRLDRR